MAAKIIHLGNQWVILANKCKFGRSCRLLSAKHLFLLQMLETPWKTSSSSFPNFWCQRFQAAGCNSPPPSINPPPHNRPGSRPRICVLSDSLISCHPFTINARSAAVIYAAARWWGQKWTKGLSLVPQNVPSSGSAGFCRVCSPFRVLVFDPKVTAVIQRYRRGSAHVHGCSCVWLQAALQQNRTGRSSDPHHTAWEWAQPVCVSSYLSCVQRTDPTLH